MSKSHTKRFVQSAWALLSFQFIASAGAVGVTALAAFHVQDIAARLENGAPQQVEEAVREPERSPDADVPADGDAPAHPGQTEIAEETRTPETPAPATVARCDVRRNVIRVPANVEWCDSGLVVQRGQRLLVTVRGTWGHGRDAVFEPGGGDVSEPRAVTRRASHGALIGRAGETIFFVGAGGDVQMPDSGPLQFSINDIPGQFGDNAGYLEIYVQPAQGEQRAPAN